MKPYSWNNQKPTIIELEDDTLREGLQADIDKYPSNKERSHLLNSSIEIGIENSILGFPVVSDEEREKIQYMLKHMPKSDRFNPWLLGRTDRNDINAVLKMRDRHCQVGASLFFSASPIRRIIEGDVSLENQLEKLQSCLDLCKREDLKVSYSIEDATRTPRDEIEKILDLLIGYNVESIAICDTTGISLPEGVNKIIRFTHEYLNKKNSSAKIIWHGHNDLGLGHANALQAVFAGANIISGTFMGLGERAGNTSLEQIIVSLYLYGNRNYKVDLLYEHCNLLAKYTDTNIPKSSPLIGESVFSTSTGTHCNAIDKARTIHHSLANIIYSPFDPNILNRKISITQGSNIGRSGLRLLFQQYNIPYNDQKVEETLSKLKSCKSKLEIEKIFIRMMEQDPTNS